MSDLASALSLTHPDNMESQAGYVGQDSRLLCAPGLEELRLRYMIVRSTHGERAMSRLRKALSTRKGHGRALKQVIICYCIRGASDLKEVLELPVGEVWLDGKGVLKSD
jgi:hypothetical protein